jgi:hypothetical protein
MLLEKRWGVAFGILLHSPVTGNGAMMGHGEKVKGLTASPEMLAVCGAGERATPGGKKHIGSGFISLRKN